MARLKATGGNSILSIKDFLGLNENPDGDTNIKPGEFSEMRNFRISSDGHMQIRPGQKTVLSLRDEYIKWAAQHSPHEESPRFCGSWSGMVGGKDTVLAAYGGVLFLIDPSGWTVKAIGQCTQDDTSFFGFGGKVYLLNGHEYMSWDGKPENSFQKVEGYIPTVITASTPDGRGTKLENVNRLTGKRKAKFSPDGTTRDFQLPEKNVDEIVSIEGSDSYYTWIKEQGLIKFQVAPTQGTNSLIITYRKGNGERAQVEKMRFAELYNGSTDARVFLYGDGTNKTIYSGSDFEKGVPSAEYFPDLYEVAVGSENSPITAMIRHYSRLLVFKSDSSWGIDYQSLTLPNGITTSAFNVTPVNRSLGNDAPGQVRLLENNPLTLENGSIYRWKAAGVLAMDARDASRISDRVRQTLRGFKFKEIKTYNDQRNSEFWFLWGGFALVLNYQSDVWFSYTNVDFYALETISDNLYGFKPDGHVIHISRQYRNDDGKPIDCYAETGSMDFGKDYQLKYSPMIYVALKPEAGGRVFVTSESNRRSDYPKKMVSAGLSNFTHVDFNHWSFGTNRKPQVIRVKLKVKKATFYKLIFASHSASATATVLQVDVAFRMAGKVK